ncbi:unnamed protein product, partial [Dibothriocephalus latus]
MPGPRLLQSQWIQKKIFTETFEAGFKITSAKLDGVDCKACATTPAEVKTDIECYNQSETSKVHFIIDDRKKYTEVQFMVKDVAKAKYTIGNDGNLVEKKQLRSEETVPTGGPIEQTNFPLPFVPDAMQLIPTETVGDTVNSRAAAVPVVVKEACKKTAEAPAEAKTNCFEVSTRLFPVTVKAKMESTNRILTLEGA